MKRQTSLLLVGLVAVACSQVSADLVPVGDPIDGNSWYQAWEESSKDLGNFDFVALRLVGNQFEVPGVLGAFAPTSWTLQRTEPQLITMSGPDLSGASALKFTLRFDNNTEANAPTFSMEEAVFHDGVLLGTTHLTYKDEVMISRDGAYQNWQWKFYDAGASPFWNPTIEQVPAPGAVLLGMMGFGLIGWLKRRLA